MFKVVPSEAEGGGFTICGMGCWDRLRRAADFLGGTWEAGRGVVVQDGSLMGGWRAWVLEQAGEVHGECLALA
jgi:hypothetical protein